MLDGVDILEALSQPLRALVDPQERIFWGFLLSSLAMPWLVLGLRRGTTALREGLLRRGLWTSASSRADVTLVFAKALLWALLRVPWLAATGGAALTVALWLHQWLGPAPALGLSRTTVAILYSVVLFIGWDLSRFALHWLMHRVRLLWAFHQVHHSAPVLTPLTLYRTHPVETLLYDLRGLVVTAAITGAFAYLFAGTAEAIELLGVGVFGFLFNLAGANLRHSHVWLGFGRLERWLLSPAQHQLHHAVEPSLQGSNLGTWIALWDRVAGTWRPSPDRPPSEYGLRDSNHRFDGVLSMLYGPLLDAVRWRERATGTVVVIGLALWSRSAGAHGDEPEAASPPSAGDEPEGTSPPSDGVETESASPPSEAAPPEATDASPDGLPPDALPSPGISGSNGLPTTPSSPEPRSPKTDDPDAAGARPTGQAVDLRPRSGSPTVDAPGDAATETSGASTEAASEGGETGSAGDGEAEADDASETRTVRVGSMFPEDGVSRVAGSAHILDERELERHEYDDVHRVLSTVPGVYVRGEDGFGLRPNIGLRGATAERSAKIVLLEDGVPMAPAPYAAPQAYYFPLTTRMVGMEVFKGPAAVQHGPNTIGGAVNLLTRQIPLTHMSEVDLAGGRFGYAKGHAFYGTTYKGFGVLVEAARVQSTGFKQLDTGDDTGFAKNDAMLKLGYRTPSGRRIGHIVELKGGFTNEDSNETYLGLSEADFGSTPYRRYAASAEDNMGWWRSQAELTYVLHQQRVVEVEARVYRHDFHRVWRRLNSFRGGPALSDILANPDTPQTLVLSAILRGEQDSVLPQQALLVTNNDRRYVSQGVQTAFRWRPEWAAVRQELEFGARVHADSVERNHTEDAFLMNAGLLVPEGTDRVPAAVNRGDALAAAFHLHDAITVWDRLTVAPGVRMELISTRYTDQLATDAERTNRQVYPAVLPGVGVLVDTTPWLDLFAGVHRGFSALGPGQASEARPEYAVNYEAGTRASWKGLRAEAVGFVSDYSNILGFCSFSAGCVDSDGSQQVNGGEALMYGVETLARYRHRFERGIGIELGGRYTYTGTRFETTFTSANPQWGDVVAGHELPYVPRHVGGGVIGVGGRRWGVSVSPSYNGAMRDVAGQGPIPDDERIPGFFVLDAGGEVRVLQRFRIYTQLGNLTNSAYIASRRPFGIRPGAPLTVMVGVKASIFP